MAASTHVHRYQTLLRSPTPRSPSSLSLPALLYDDTDSSDSDFGSQVLVASSSSSTPTSLLANDADSMDITDFEPEQEAPIRPTSRLGFNRALFAPPERPSKQAERETRSAGTLRWTRALFQTTTLTPAFGSGVADTPEEEEDDFDDPASFVDISLGDDNNLSEVLLSPPPPSSSSSPSLTLELEELGLDEAMLSEDSDSSDDESVELGRELDLGLFPPPPPIIVSLPKVISKPTPVSIPIPQPEPEHTPTKSAPFSCLPSPLSPRSTPIYDAADFGHQPSHPQPLQSSGNPLRHLYSHRGFSRHGLNQLKWFWNMRQDDWMEAQFKLEQSVAYGGLAALPLTRSAPDFTPVSRVAEQQTSSPGGKQCAQKDIASPKPSMHPRIGDVLSLRDVYCSQIDQCFWGLPLWTLKKMLYMFDVHVGAERGCRVRAGKEREGVFCVGNDEEEEGGDGDDDGDAESLPDSMHMSISSEFSDGSDSTLVESECNLSLSGSDPCASSSLAADNLIRIEDASDAASTVKIPPSFSFSPSFSSPSSPTFPRHWESNWYGRWELLIELIQQDQERGGFGILKNPIAACSSASSSSSCSVSTGTSGGVSLGGGKGIFLGEAEEMELGEEDNEFWADEEEDYGVLVSNPVFGRFGVIGGAVR